MTSIKATRPAASKSSSRTWQVGIAAMLMLTASPLALHAETSNAELAKEIAELKAQIRSMKGSISETRAEARKAVRVRSVAPAYVPPPAFAAIPPGATPVFATADKKMIFGNLVITPGGYVDVDGIYRTRNLQSDVTTPYNGIPTLNNNLAHVGEARFSIRQSRAALLVEAPIAKNFLIAGYGEFDLNAAGTTSNSGQTSSYVPRVRNLYTTLDVNDYGLHVLAGQNWSLITTNSKGITPRNEVLPPGVDSGVLVGYDYARTPQIRVVKDFDKKLWIALSAEIAQTGFTNCGATVSNTSTAAAATNNTSVAANGFTGVAAGTCQAIGAGSFGQGGQNQQLSINSVPDVLGKVAYEARIGDRDIHLEAIGIYKDTLSYVNYSGVPFAAAAPSAAAGFPFSTEHNKAGGGVGFGLVAPVIVGKLDVQVNGEYGRGLGRYTSSGVPDSTVGPDGVIKPLLGYSASTSLIYHATPSFDIYASAGIDSINRNFAVLPNGTQVGYGTTGGASNVGCYNVGGTCAGVTHRVYELSAGFVDKLYKGSFGELRASVQYEYVNRQLYGATGNANGVPTAAAPYLNAKTSDNIVFTSLRYFPFQ